MTRCVAVFGDVSSQIRAINRSPYGFRLRHAVVILSEVQSTKSKFCISKIAQRNLGMASLKMTANCLL